MKNKNNLKILTFNTGLLNISLFGRSVYEPTPYVKERLAALPNAIIRSRADIVGLQEVYGEKYKKFLISKLKKYYPYHFYCKKKRKFRSDIGLMFFSKSFLIGKKLLTFKNKTMGEELVAYKAAISVRTQINNFKEITFYNIHTTEGDMARGQENASIEKIRGTQIHQIIESIKNSPIHKPKIILGDINAGAEVSKKNYCIWEKFGFIDVFSKKHPFSNSKKTWEPKNFLNKNGPYKKNKPQTIDHIFLRAQDIKNFKINQAKIVFITPLVKISHRKITLSDHYGLLISLKLKK